jgi:hypothetical protein
VQLIGGLFKNKQELSLALADLQDEGFVAFQVFGPNELFRSPGTDDKVEESVETPKHTAGGTIDGIAVTPRPLAPSDPSAQSVGEDFEEMGIPEQIAGEFVAGLHQDLLLLLVQTKADRGQEALQVMKEHEATLVHQMEPADMTGEEMKTKR